MKIDDAEGFDSKMLALTVGGTQAYVMLELFAAMVKPGQGVLITDPLSAVGQALVLIAALLQLRPYCVLEHGELDGFRRKQLEKLGAAEVFDRGTDIAATLKDRGMKRPVVCFDSIGGRVDDLLGWLDPGRTSRLVCCGTNEVRVQPVGLGEFQGSIVGFSLLRWSQQKPEYFRSSMREVVKLWEEGKLTVELETLEFERAHGVNASDGAVRQEKANFREPNRCHSEKNCSCFGLSTCIFRLDSRPNSRVSNFSKNFADP